MNSRMCPKVLRAVEDAAVAAFWYKHDLARFLREHLDQSLPGIGDLETKRVWLHEVLERIDGDTDRGQDRLERLADALLALRNFPGLLGLEGSEFKIAAAFKAQAALREIFKSQQHSKKTGSAEKKENSDTRKSHNVDGHPNLEKHYGRVLGLTGKVTPEQIKTHYRELMKKYHPDRFHGLSEEFVKLATATAQEINTAYEFFCRRYQIN